MSYEIKWNDLPAKTKLAAYSLLGITGFLIWDQYHWWKLRDEYAFGYIVPLFVAFIIYDRWGQIAESLIGVLVRREGNVKHYEKKEDLNQPEVPKRSFWSSFCNLIAFMMVIGGLLTILVGVLYRAIEGQNLIASNCLAFGFANILLGTVFVYTDHRSNGEAIPLIERLQVTFLFLFPALIWMLSVPMFSAVHKSISTFLMNKVAIVVYHTFDILGYAIVREGSVLKLPLGDVGVEDACSGIRSLTACLFAGSFLGAAYFKQLWKKVFLVGTAMFFAFFNNILRSLFLTAWAYGYGPTALEGHVDFFGMDLGNVHDLTGWFVLGITVVCLLILVKLFSIEFESEDPNLTGKHAEHLK